MATEDLPVPLSYCDYGTSGVYTSIDCYKNSCQKNSSGIWKKTDITPLGMKKVQTKMPTVGIVYFV